ncbi:outer membrane protein assembly factor BamB family protein [Sorangium sp. So ce131]|uniref:outer membrane protein assembly factor BamB family protein n=1 Tax=Sorangium sp. So ce131 TaxID=3133282 RepID=UPI003F5EF71B
MRRPPPPGTGLRASPRAPLRAATAVRALLLAPAGALAALAVACGGGQTQGEAFDRRWKDDRGAGIAEFQQRFAGTPIPTGVDVAVGVAGEDARRIVGVPLDGGPAWSFVHRLNARPAVAGNVVVGLGRGELFALDARTGKLLWKRNAGGRLRGAGDDGEVTVVSIESTTGTMSVVLAVNRDGEVLRQIEDTAVIGVPAVVGRYAFLPWEGRYVTVFDLQTGREAARTQLRAEMSEVSRAFLLGGAVFFGGEAATRFDEAIGLAPAGRASTARLPPRELPGTPAWLTGGTEVPGPIASTDDKARRYARPRAAGPAGIEGERFAATYYRIAVGFDARSGALAWAHAGEADFLGGAAYAGGFALCDARGGVAFLDAQRGSLAGRASFGRPIQSCVVQADGLTAASIARGAAGASAAGTAPSAGTAPPSETMPPAATAPPAPAASLTEQIERVLTLPQPELASMQRLLRRELDALPSR